MRYTETTDDSAVSPVIGVILMVAITVILAAVIGTFVLGLGENVDGTTSAGVSVDQTAGERFTITLVDSGNLDTAGVVGPDGARSAFGSTDDLLQAGSTVRVADGAAFDRDPEPVNASLPSSLSGAGVSVANDTYLVASSDSDNIGPTANGAGLLEECYISHSANVVSGVYVDQAGIGCSGLALQSWAASTTTDSTAADTALTNAFPNAEAPSTQVSGAPPVVDEAEASSLSTGSPIEYEPDAEFSLVGTVDGSENVVQSFTTQDD